MDGNNNIYKIKYFIYKMQEHLDDNVFKAHVRPEKKMIVVKW